MKKILFLLFCFVSLFANTVNEHEPNNSYKNATSISINDTGTGSLNSSNDKKDWWTFTVLENGYLTIYTTDSTKDIRGHLFKNDNDNKIKEDKSNNNNINISNVPVYKNTKYYLKINLNPNVTASTNYELHFVFTPNDNSSGDDICYDDMQTSGLFCMAFGPCAGGIGCKETYPLRVNSSLQNVKIYYDESNLIGGSFGSNCGVKPDGNCSTVHSIDFGPFGFFDQATEFDLGDINQSTNPDIWVRSFAGGKCFYSDQLYVEYDKDDQHYKEKLKKCGENSSSDKFRDFTIRNPGNTRNINGNVKVIGNTVLKSPNGDNGQTNDEIDLQYVDVDDNPDTFNSSKARLDIPSGSTIIWAGLYTQGYLQDVKTINGIYQVLNDSDYPLYLTIPSIGTITVAPEVIDYSVNKDDNTIYGYTYSTYSEIKQLEGKKASDVYGWITAANIKCYEGPDPSGLGNFGAWTLVVVYKNPNEKFRNISVFDGYKKVDYDTDKNVTIHVSGFLTPLYGPINSTLSLFVGEGDKYITGDALYFNGNGINTDNAFDSSITGVERDPSISNNQGIDIQNHDVSQYMYNGETDANITLTTEKDSNGYADTYYPSVIVFSTDLYVPKVCYYDLNLYDENNNLIAPGSTINLGEKVKIAFKIKNDENETAKNVYIIYPFDENNMIEYVPDSTSVMNVLEDSYTHFNDNETHGNLGVYVNDKVLNIGVLGDSNKEFLPFDTNNSYVSGIEFNLTLNNEGNLSFVFYTDYNYTLGNENYTYHGRLPKCSDFDVNYRVYNPPLGTFNVVNENFSGNIDPADKNDSLYDLLNALYTQIVNKPFNVKILHLDNNKETLSKNFKGIVRVDLIKTPIDSNLSDLNLSKLEILNTKYVAFNNNEINISSFNSSKSVKNACFIVRYLVDDNGNPVYWNCTENTNNCIWGMLEKTYDCNNKDRNCTCEDVCKPGSGTGNNQASEECIECVFNNYNVGYVLSRDNFAIRPDKYKVLGLNKKLIAGKDTNITIQALDYNGNLITDFNFSNAPIEINVTDAIGCKTGDFNPKITEVNFTNGEANLTTFNYKDVGDLNISVKEYKNSNFYAKVDENDTVNSAGTKISDDVLLISEGSSTFNRFYPDHFSLVGSYYDYNHSKFTYISNDLNMSSVLDLNITAENEQNGTTFNYNKECYAKNFDVNISHSVLPNNIQKILYKEDLNNSEFSISKNQHIDFTNLSKNYFSTDHNGTAVLKIKINFDKNYSNPVNEFNFTIQDINISDINGTFGNTDLDQNTTFKYGRIHVKEATRIGNEVNTTFKYEYWDKNKGWVINKEHSKDFGEVNLSKSYVDATQFDNSPMKNSRAYDVKNGLQNVKFTTTHSLPYSAKVHLSIPNWLWYNPLAKDYKYPSSSNHDCRTHPCMKVTFYPNSSGWAGISGGSKKLQKEFNESKRTVEVNTSKEVNVSKKEVKKINW
jgi:hypothetical protein